MKPKHEPFKRITICIHIKNLTRLHTLQADKLKRKNKSKKAKVSLGLISLSSVLNEVIIKGLSK